MGWSWRKWLERYFLGRKGISATVFRRSKRGTRSKAVQLYMETLEERTVPTGVWTPLTHSASISVGTMELLPNGDVAAMDDGGNSPGWVELTPSASGSYSSGTWSNLANMDGARLYAGTVVLPSDQVLVFGGEYFNGPQAEVNSGQIYNIATNTWTTVAPVPVNLDPLDVFGDSAMQLLPNGNVLAQNQNGTQTFLYNVTTNTWSAGPTEIDPGVSGYPAQSSEEPWIKLPGTGGNILDPQLWASLGVSPGFGEYLNTPTNTWTSTGRIPVALSEASETEYGPGVLLPNGEVFQVGANGSFGGTSDNTALFNPATNTWVAGPVVPGTMTADDAPGAILADGNVLFTADSSIPSNPAQQYSAPSAVFEYNYVTNTITQLTTPAALTNQLNNDASYVTRLLALPNGQILFTDGGQMWTYSESGAPLASSLPTISGIVNNGGGIFTLTGTQLTGMSEGAGYGDDANSATDYPLVQLTNTAGNVFYAETSNWSNPGTVQTGNTVETTKFTMPGATTPGAYLLSVSSAGILSNAILNVQMGGSATNLVLRIDPANAANVQVMNGASVLGEYPLADFNSIMVTGDSVGPDTLTVDYTNGDPIPAGGLSYTGNASNNNILGFKAGNFASETYTPSGPNAGTITFPGQTISFTNVSTINDLAGVTSATINGTSGAETINIATGPIVSSTQTNAVSSGGNTFATIDFANKATVTVNGLTGADTYTINDPTSAAGLTTLDVDSGASTGVTFDVLATSHNFTTSVLGDASLVSVNIGNAGLVQGILGAVSIDNSSGAHTAVTVDDSSDTTSQTFTLSSGQIQGLASANITYVPADTQSVTVNGGSGGNNITVASASVGLATNVNCGNGDDYVTVNPMAIGTNLSINGELPTPPTLPGNTLFYTSAGSYLPSGVGAGTVSQSGYGTFSISNFSTISVGADAGQSSVTIVPSTVVSGSTATVTLQARDSSGNNLITGGLSVTFGLGSGAATGTFSPVIDNGNGTYTSTFTAILAGSNTITATIQGAPVTHTPPTFTVVPGALNLSQSNITVASTTDVSGATDLVTLISRDSNGNQLLSGGATVVLGLGSGTSTGAVAPVPATDNGNGTYSATFTGILVGSPRTITGTINGSPIGTMLPTITVTAGQASLANSIVTVASANDVSGTTDVVTLTTIDAAGNHLTTGGLNVTITLGSGTSTGSLTGVTDNGNGTYTATFIGILAGTPLPIDATIGGSNVTSTPPTITVIPGAVNLLQSTYSVVPSSILSGTTAIVTLVARDAAGNQEASGGLSVGFGLGAGGASSGTFSAVTDNGNGTYTSIFTGTTTGTARFVTATIGGASVLSATPTVTVNPGVVSLATSTVAVAQAMLQSFDVETVTLTTRDAAGNLESTGGLSVVFHVTGAGTSTGILSADTDLGNGIYTATFTGILAGTPIGITATISGGALTSTPPTITVTPGSFSLANSLVTVAQASIQSGSTDLVTLTARDAAGNQLGGGGLVVGFGVGAGSSTGTYGSVTDHNNGTYTTLFTGVLAGTPTTITASIGGGPVSSVLPTIMVTPGAISLAQSIVAVAPGSIQSGGTATVTLTARDAAGNQEAGGGATVVFSLGAGGSSGTFGGVADNGNGTYTSTFTGVLAGSPRTITATVNSGSVTSTLPTITVTPGSFSLAASSLTVGQSTDASGGTDLVLLTARDANGNQETSGGLAVTFGLGSGGSTGTLSGVVDNGNGTYAASFTGVLAGTPRTIMATIGGSAITSTLPTITVVPGVVSLATSTLAAAPASIESGATATVTLTTRDAAGNLETSGGQAVVFGLGAGTSGGVFSGFQDDGNGTYSETFTGGAIGSPTTVTATIAGSPLTSTLPTITVTPGPASLANSFVSDVPGTIPAGTNTTLTLTAVDAFGNPENTGGLSVAFQLVGGAASGAIGPVTDNGNGTYTATFFDNGVVGTNAFTATIGGSSITSTPAGLTVIPAAFDLGQSTIAIAPSSIASGTGATVTMTARDSSGNQEPTGGLIVTFGLAGGTATGSFSATTDNHNGTYTTTFTGILAGTNAIAAFIGGAPVTSGNPAVTVTPGAVSLAASTVAIAPTSITSGSTATITLTARDAAGNQETGSGLAITFAPGGGSSTGAIGAVTAGGNGTYFATFTGALAGTPRTITADIGGSPLTSPFPAVTVTPGAVSLAQSLISVAPTSIISGSTATVTLTARDADGNQETSGGLAVIFALGGGSATGSFSAVTDDHDGIYTAVFTGALDGSNTVTASINAQNVTSTDPTVFVTPGPVSLAQSSVAIAPSSLQAGGAAVVTLTARDAAGNQELSGGLGVSFTLGGGLASGNFSSLTDNHNGTYTANFTAIVAGTNTVSASINGQPLTAAAPTFTVTPGPISLAQSTVSIAPASIFSGGSTAVTLIARDAEGNQEPSGGLTVAFGLGGGTATGSFSAVTDHGNGAYTASFTGILAGNNSITATINGQSVTSGNPAISVAAGPFSLAQSTVTVTPGNIQSGAAATVTLTARDAAGDQEGTGGLSVSFNLGAGTATGAFGPVTDNGNGTYSAAFTGILAGSSTIVGSINTLALTSSAPTITVTPGAYDLAASTLTVAPASVQSGSNATLTVTTRDAAGNQEPTGGLIVTVNFGGGTSTGTLTSVTDNGDGTYTAAFTGVLVGTARTVTAAINGNALTSALPTITVTPGPVSLTQSTVSAAPTSIQSGGASSLTLTARDAAGNQETTGGLNVSFTLGAGSATGAFGTVTDNGNGTYSATFTGQGAGTRAIVGAVNSQGLTSTPPVITVAPGTFSLGKSTVSIAPTSIQSGATTTVTLTVRDAAGNQETSGGLSVAFALGGGSATGAFSNFSDNHNGTYTETFTGILVGTNTITATIGGSAVTSAPPTITVTPGVFSVLQSSVSVAPASIPSATTAAVTLTARDAAGNLETTGGLAVGFGLGVGAATGTFGAVTDNANGTYSAIFTGIHAGANTIIAAINGQGVTSAAPAITVTPGAVSLAQSTVSVAPASVQSGGAAVVTLTARDINGNPETTGGLTVGFGLGAGTATGSFSAVTDNHNGRYTATFTGILAGGNTVTATIGGQPTTTAAPTVTVTPGPFSLAQSTVAIAPVSIPSGTTATVTLTARDAAGNQEASGGLSVTFGLGVGTATGAFSAVTDLGDGVYTAAFTGVLVGTNTVVAKINAVNLTSPAPTLTVTPGAISLATSTVAVAPSTIPSGSAATVTITVRDAAGNFETAGGAAVALSVSGSATGNFGPVIDNHNGTYTASFIGVQDGAGAITATINTLSLASAPAGINVTPGPVSLANSTLAITPGSIQSGSTATITLVAVDANGNVETSGGLNVAFAVGAGSATGVIGPVTDLHNGHYTATFTGVLAGTSTIAAKINGLAVTSTAPTITVTPGALSLAQSIVTIAPASIPSGSTATITLSARDAAGNQESGGGLSVAFALGAGSATGTLGPVADLGNGAYTASFTGILVGTNIVTATINTQAVTSTPPTLTVSPGPFSVAQSTVAIAPASVPSGSTALVTLTARDAAGNLDAAGGLAAGFTLGAGSATGSFSAVTDLRNGTYTAIFTGLAAGTNAVNASLDGQTLTAAAPITVTPGPFSLAQSTITIAPASVQAGGTALLTLTARDAGGDQESTGGLLVGFNFGAGSATGSIGAITDNHNGTYTAVFTGIASGTRAISASIDGQALTSAPATITVAPGPFSLSQSSVTIAPASIQAGTSALVTLTARDADGNPETAGGLGVSFTLGGGNATGTFGPVTDNHNGTYTASFTGNLAGNNAILGAINGQALLTAEPAINVTPGPVSLAGSTIVLAPGSIQVGGQTFITLTTADAFGNRETSGGASVAFTLASGNISGSFSAVSDHHDGTYSVVFTAGAGAGAGLVTATINGQSITSTAPTLHVTAGSVSLSQSYITLAPPTVQAGGTTIVTLTTADANGNLETSGGLPVSFGLAAGSASGTFGNVIDNGNGAYTATLTAGSTIGTNTVTATIGGQFVLSVPPTLTVSAGPVSLSQSNVTVTPASVGVGGTTTVTLLAEDALGNQEPTGGLSVAFHLGSGTGSGTFGNVVDNGNGTYTASFTGILAGANTITATINAQGLTSPAAAVTITPESTTTTLVPSVTSGLVFGQSVGLTAVVAAAVPGFGTPTGAVSFYDGATFLGSSGVNGSGVAAITANDLPVGTQTLTDTYSGDANFASSSGAYVNYTDSPANTAVNVSASPPSGSTFGQSVTLTATLSATGASTAAVNGGIVSFYDGAVLLGTSNPVVGGIATLATTALAVNSNSTITAVYSGSANFNGVTGTLPNYAVAAAGTSVAVVSSAPVAGVGQAVTFTATVASSTGAIVNSGNVSFYDGAVSFNDLLGTSSNVAAGQASFTTTGLTRGVHAIIAAYADTVGDFGPSDSSAASQTVISADNVSVTASPSVAVFGQAVTFTITVTGTGGTPSGAVSILQGAVALGGAALVNGKQTITLSSLGVGANALVVAYTGDAVFAPHSANFIQQVNPAATTTTVSPTGTSVFGQAVAFTATVSVKNPGAGSLAGGTVTFKDGATFLGAGTVNAAGIATFTTANTQLAAGSHAITASYGASTNFAASVSVGRTQTVTAAGTKTTVATTAPGGSTYTQSVTFTATVAASSPSAATATGGSISFYNGVVSAANLLGTAPLVSGVASFSTAVLTVANHTIIAVYSGATGFAASSGTITQSVSAAGTSTTLSSSQSAGSNFGQSVTFTAAVAVASPGTGKPTGTVRFYDGGILLGSATLNAAGAATLTTASLAANPNHTITAVYAGSANYAGSASSTLVQAVNPAVTTVTLAALASTVKTNQALTFAASVKAGTGGTPTGSVTFVIDNGAQSFTQSLANGAASFKFVGFLTPGFHTVQAVYNPTPNFANSSSSAANINALASSSVALSSSANAAIVGSPVTITAAVAGPAGTPIGDVSFYDGKTLLGTVALNNAGAAAITLPNLTIGIHSITATYSGDPIYAAASASALRQVINPQPSGRLT